jgi:hypothetical protein
MGTPIPHEELRQSLEWALNFAHPDDLARHLLGIAQALQLDTAVLIAGKGVMGIAEHVASVLQLELHRSLNGGW